MNVQINDLNETRKTLTITLDKGEVDGEYQKLLAEFAREASIPGFRPGKAPAALIAKRYAKELKQEFTGRVVSAAYRHGIEESKLNVLQVTDVSEGTIEPGLSAAVTLTLDIRPEFTLPDYVGLPTTIEPAEVPDAEVDALLEGLRRERADFKPVELPAAKGDYVRFGYTGSLPEGSLAEIVGDKTLYASAPQSWEEAEGEQEGLLPGLAPQLTGLKSGDKKTVTLTYPADFSAAPGLAGKAVNYELDIQEVRARVLPEIDEAFLKANQADSLDALKEQIRRSLAARKEHANRAAQRRQVTDALLAHANFPAPESLVAAERDAVLRQFIEDNMRRGVPQEEFEKNKQELHAGASKAAVARIKVQLMLARIAEAEKLSVEDKDLSTWIMREALRTGEKPDRLAKDLGRNREQLRGIQEQLLFDKALDFLVSKATVTMAPAKA